MKKKLSILLAGVCLTAALYSAGTTYGQNKTNSAKLKEYGTMQACKEKGLVRQEGKEYVVKDGDIIVFRFNV